MEIMSPTLFPKLAQTVNELARESTDLERRKILQPFIDYLQGKLARQEEIRLNFICTHNSRRSHLAQVWAQALAHYFALPQVSCYSGGTEATALFPRIAETLAASGFTVSQLSKGINPVYSLKFSANEAAVIGFSKQFENPFNPQSHFAAVLTCAQADADCPFVAGAEKRISIPFEDPKAFDESPQAAKKYEECSRQIASEWFYVFNQLSL